METLSETELADIALGGTVLGTGGGGSFSTADAILRGPLRSKRVRMVSLSEAAETWRILPVAGMGSPEAMLKTPLTTEGLNAYAALAKTTRETFQAVMPLETSGFNFLAPMTVSAAKGIPIVDADGAGRAIPRLNLTLFYAAGISVAPLALADAKGTSVVIHADRYDLAEKTAVTALGEFGWFCGLACYPMGTRDARRASVGGTISLARTVGEAIRRAVKSGADPVAAVLKAAGGSEAVRGTVERIEAETKGSYTFGIVDVRGTGSHAGHSLRVKSMNENMAMWKDGRLRTTAPDRICYLSPDGAPVTNADLKAGDEIAVFTIPAQRNWKGKRSAGLFQETLEAMGL